MRAGTILLLTILLAGTSIARSDEFPVGEVPGHGPGGAAVYIGGTSSDLGGESRMGLSLGLFGKRRPLASRLGYRFGLEFADKRNVGTVTQRLSWDTGLIYTGPGTVSLKYIQAVGQLQYAVGIGRLDVVPYVGLAPAILINQEVRAEADDVTLGDLDYYSDFDVCGLIGLELGYRQLRLDLQFAQGLRDLEASRERAAGDAPPRPLFEPADGRSQSFRLAAGAMF